MRHSSQPGYLADTGAIIPVTPTPPLLVATTNPGKIREIRLLLTFWPRLWTLRDVPPIAEPEETGTTFAQNAALKARYYAAAAGVGAVAEDSGLVIDALGGAPGVHSARYPGETYPDKFKNLHAALAAHPRPWTARYVCALAVSDTSKSLLFECNATVEGEIWPVPRGTRGFGYDPVFHYPDYGRTFGEIDEVEKLAVAHRGRAFRMLNEWLAATPVESLR
jgi:XTP/dITP diphosphohydrolase